MKIGIRAWIDFAFRKIFGKPGNEICLISLLNAVLRFPSPVVSVEYLNPFGVKRPAGWIIVTRRVSEGHFSRSLAHASGCDW
jgi:hypothetical protein